MSNCIFTRILHLSASSCAKKYHLGGLRTLLSEAYQCRTQWSARHQTPILSKVNPSDFAMRLQEKFDKEGKVSEIDIDILANKLDRLDNLQLEFATNLFYRFRHTIETVKTRESTHHALVRAFIDQNEVETLIQILKDKIHYGIFLDYYTANILLDLFIEAKQYQEAAGIAYDMMLQEDFAHPLTRHLAWYACHLHWKNPPPPTEQEPEPEDKEEKWVKVGFIKNPWYDDHWDIPTDSQRLGKTLTMVASENQDSLGLSYQLIGWGLYQKFDKGIDLLKRIKQEQKTIDKSVISAFSEMLNGLEPEEVPEEKEAGLRTVKDVTPVITAEQKETYVQELQAVLSELESSPCIVEEDLEAALLARMGEVISSCEAHDISQQEQLFEQWNTERAESIQQEVDDMRKHERKVNIVQKLMQIQEKEEKLRFFELQDRIKLAQSRVPKERPIDEEVEEEQFVAAPGERGKGFM